MAKNMDSSNYLGQLEDMLDEYLVRKAPALPENIKEALTKIIPWLVLISVILGVLGVLSFFGVTGMAASFGMMGVQGSTYSLIYEILIVVVLVLEGLAIQGLFKRTMQGWRYSFYATLVSLLMGIFGGNPVVALIQAVIALYILFQIRSYYK